MPRELPAFLHLHPGDTAWIFGKGPSLDSFDMAQAGPLRVAINDVLRYVPGVTYCFANDSVRDWLHLYQPHHVLFTPRRTLHSGPTLAPLPPCEVVVINDEPGSDRLTWSAAQLARDGLAIAPGTLGTVAQVLYLMGVRRLVCVGIDGGGQHAARPFLTRLRPDHAQDYNSIRSHFITYCAARGIDLYFHGTDHTQAQLTSGMKLIRILEATFCRGLPLEPGAICEVLPEDAATLVQCGRAVYHAAEQPAPPPAPETAALAPAIETAVRPRAHHRRLKA